jgi:uncharacterized repeat protein (TIGR01451 family)
MKGRVFQGVWVPWAAVVLAMGAWAMAPAPRSAGSPGQATASQALPAAADGRLSGYVRDANTGEGLRGYVYLYDAGDPAVEYEARAFASGYYTVTVPAGSYDVYGSAAGYERVDTTVAIAEGETTHLDLDLPAPILGWAPGAIGETMDAGETREVSIVLSNTGSGDLYYRIDEVAPGSDLPAPARAAALPGGVDPRVYAELEASPEGTAEVLVVMAEQADLSAAYGIADWRARGRYVYDALRDTAGRSQARVRARLEEAGIGYRSYLSVNGLTLVADEATVTDLAAMPEVGGIEPAGSFDLPEPTVDEARAPAFIGWNLKKVRADRVWDEFGATGQGMVVASIDTGVEWTHPALKEQYRGWDGTTADHDYNWWDPRGVCSPVGEPCDNYWHGTHVMGLMVGSDLAADPLNAPNAIGMAPGAQWMACKGCEMADGWSCSTAALLECADFVLAPWDQNGQNPDPDLRPNVVNNSWGGSANDGWYYTAIAAWRAAGIFPAFSAGNGGPYCNTVNSPSDYGNALATGATDSSDHIVGFSSRGGSVLGLLKPEVTAPGEYVRSALPGGSYGAGSGTSMASPHTAGEVALVWSARLALVGQVGRTEALIEQTAEGLTTAQTCDGVPGSEVPNNTFGWGRIDAYRAVSAALAYDWDVSWLAVSPTGGRVEPGGVATVTVTLDSEGLGSQPCYQAGLALETNDPYEGPVVSLPVELCIGAILSKEVRPAQQAPGGVVTYTIVFGNQGEPVSGVVVTDTLPPQVELARATPAGTYDAGAHELVWQEATLETGERVTATVAVTLGAEIPPCTWLTNTVYLAHEGRTQPLMERARHSTGVDVSGVTLTVVTRGTLHTGEEVAFSADLVPDHATRPYSYRLGAGEVMTSSLDPLPLGLTFTRPGTHTVAVEVWNCGMARPVSDTVAIGVEPRYYLPMVFKDG